MASDLKIKWDGKTYTVPENQMFELIDAVERHVSLPELLAMIGSGRPNFSMMARPFHAMLTFAGVLNVPELLELRRMLVREGMQNAEAAAKGKDAPDPGPAMTAIAAMCELLMDGATDTEAFADADPKEKKTKPRSQKGATKSR
jgi:hypothetical protein